MASWKQAAPVCSETNPLDLDLGTSALTQSPLPGTLACVDQWQMSLLIPNTLSKAKNAAGQKKAPQKKFLSSLAFLFQLRSSQMYEGVPLAHYRRLCPDLTMSQVVLVMPRFGQGNDGESGSLLQMMNATMRTYEINTYLRQAAFLAQLAVESAELTRFKELGSGNEYDPTVNPTAAKNLGNTQPGDGVKFKGRGPLQLTGRWNYEAFAKYMKGKGNPVDVVENPDLLGDPKVGFAAAGWFWSVLHKANVWADKPDFETVCRRVNGGYNGFDARVKYYQKALHVLCPTG